MTNVTTSVTDHGDGQESSYVRRVLVTVGITTGALLGALVLWQTASVLVLLFGGVLLAVVLRGAAESLSAWTRLPVHVSLGLVLFGLFGGLAAAGWFLNGQISGEFHILTHTLKTETNKLEQQLVATGWVPEDFDLKAGAFGRGNVFTQITGAFSLALGALSNLGVILFVGIFVALDPERYRKGVLHMLPFPARERTGQVLDTVCATLRRWMLGRLLDMLIVGAMTTVGLLLLGTPAAIGLGVLTGLIVFIPYLGPILSIFPAVLVGLTLGREHAAYVALLYLAIQTVETYLIQPFIEDQAIDLPSALGVGAQLVFGVLLGTLGVIFAIPLMAALAVTVKMLYVKDTLGDQIPVQDEPAPAPTPHDESPVHPPVVAAQSVQMAASNR